MRLLKVLLIVILVIVILGCLEHWYTVSNTDVKVQMTGKPVVIKYDHKDIHVYPYTTHIAIPDDYYVVSPIHTVYGLFKHEYKELITHVRDVPNGFSVAPLSSLSSVVQPISHAFKSVNPFTAGVHNGKYVILCPNTLSISAVYDDDMMYMCIKKSN